MSITLSPFVFLAIWTKGLVVPVIGAATIVMGNRALINEALGVWFLWTATVLLVDSRIMQAGYPPLLAIGLTAPVSILEFLASIIYFKREDVK